MAVLKVVKFPADVLATKTRAVDSIAPEDRQLVRDMIETMYAEKGVGLAANQVGVSKQLFVASADQVPGKELVYFNPRIIRKSGRLKEFEGCLSVQDAYEPVKRARTVWMRAMTLDGSTVEVKADGLLSRIFQHEIDHLNGFLFIDRVGPLKSRRLKKRLARRPEPQKK